MSLTAAAIEVLLSKGLTADDLLEVARAMERKSDPTNAQRQARHRAKRAKSNTVTVTPVTVSPNEYISNPHPVPSVNSNELTSPTVENQPAEPELKPEHVVEAWNGMAERIGLAVVRKLTPERRRKLQARIRQNSIDEFTEAISAIEQSPFLRGDNGRGWRADFDFLLSPTKFTKLIEGTSGQ